MYQIKIEKYNQFPYDPTIQADILLYKWLPFYFKNEIDAGTAFAKNLLDFCSLNQLSRITAATTRTVFIYSPFVKP